MNLQQLRTEIDNLDSELINVLSKRFIATRKIGQLKHEQNLEAVDTDRLNSIVENWINQSNEKEVNPELALQIINTIHRFVISEHRELK